MERGALSKKSFAKFAKKVVPYLHVTTLIKDHPYDDLLTEKGGRGFPTLMFLDAEGETLREHVGPRSPGGFEETLSEILTLRELERKAAAGDPEAAVTLMIRDFELERYDYDEAGARVAALERLSSKEKKMFAQLLVNTEVRCLARDAGDDARHRLNAGEHFAAMWKDKRVPDSDKQLYSFWSLMADYAEDELDKRLFKRIVAAFDDTLTGTRFHRHLRDLEKRLSQLARK